MPLSRSRAVELDRSGELCAIEESAHGAFRRRGAADVPEANETDADGHQCFPCVGIQTDFIFHDYRRPERCQAT